MSSNQHKIITIDGPAGTGKSVTAKDLSQRLNLMYLDSGALYRTVVLAVLRSGITDPDDPALVDFLGKLEIGAHPEPDIFRVFIGQEDVSDQIRAEKVSQNASRFATNSHVRAFVNEHCHRIAASYNCIAEGRDLGSAVFPDANLKIYLTASLEERTRRRFRQLTEAGSEVTLEFVRAQMVERDSRDKNRPVAPLCFPPGGIRIDSTFLDYEQQIQAITELYKNDGYNGGSRFYRFIQFCSKAWFKGIFGVRVSGVERIPPGGIIVACNHISNIDPPLIGGLMPCMIAFMAKEELFRARFQSALITSLCAIPIRRGKMDRKALRACLTILNEAKPLLMFPQGTRVKAGDKYKAHTGVAWLSRKAQVPVVPTRIISNGLLKSFLRLDRIHVIFGDPVSSVFEEPDLSDLDYARQVMEAILTIEPEN